MSQQSRILAGVFCSGMAAALIAMAALQLPNWLQQRKMVSESPPVVQTAEPEQTPEPQVNVSGDDPQLLSRFLREIIRYYHRDYTIRSVTLLRHAEVFRTEGFVPTKEWTQYVTMQYGKKRQP